MAYETPVDELQLQSDLRDPSKASAAFDKMMRLYGEKVYWQIRKLLINHDDSVDMLQNVFLKAWNNLANFRGDARISTWLYKIAFNESINFLNKEKQKARREVAEIDDAVMSQLESDPWFDGDELRKKLLAAVAALPEKQRLVFNMRYFDEMKYEEISEILGTSVGSLKASYHHAVKRVAKLFEE